MGWAWNISELLPIAVLNLVRASGNVRPIADRGGMMFIVSSLLAAPGFSAFVFHKCREACDLVVGGF
jgi:hypothetical protein